MRPDISARLVEINRAFYEQFAGSFDATRQRVQPGVVKMIPRLIESTRILDLGCGNGSLFRALSGRGFAGEYVGVDMSGALIGYAQKAAAGAAGARFLVRDLAGDWQEGIAAPFEAVVAFAVLHHLPPPVAAQVLRTCRGLLAPGGNLALSCWQFLNSARWRERIQDWQAAGLSTGQVGPDDYLLDWRRGGRGLRYVHLYSETALAALAEESGFEVKETYHSDGAGGNLGLYQIWKAGV